MNGRCFRCFIKGKSKSLLSFGVSALFVVCCTFITSFAALVSSDSAMATAQEPAKKRSNITVLLKKGLTDEEVAEAGRRIAAVPNISKCEYYPSKKAIEKYKDVLGDLYDILKQEENPFPEAYHITIEDLSEYSETISEIKAIANVESVSDRSEVSNI